MTRVASDAPAVHAGICVGDEIVEVDGKPVKSPITDQFEKQIRGPISTKVSLTIKHGALMRRVSQARAPVPMNSVTKCATLCGNLGYIELDNLVRIGAFSEMRAATEQLSDCSGLIIDLRKNPAVHF